MHVIGPLVGLDALEVAQVPKRLIRAEDPNAPENLSRGTGNLERRIDVVPLRQGNLHMRGSVGLLQLCKPKRHQLRLGQLGQHQGQFSLHQLKTPQRLAELSPRQRMLPGFVIAGARRSHRPPGNSIPRLVEALQWRTQAL